MSLRLYDTVEFTVDQLVAGEPNGWGPREENIRNVPSMTEVDVMVTGVHVGTPDIPPVPVVDPPGPQLDVVTTNVVVLSGRLDVSTVVVVSVVRTSVVEDPIVRAGEPISLKSVCDFAPAHRTKFGLVCHCTPT